MSNIKEEFQLKCELDSHFDESIALPCQDITFESICLKTEGASQSILNEDTIEKDANNNLNQLISELDGNYNKRLTLGYLFKITLLTILKVEKLNQEIRNRFFIIENEIDTRVESLIAELHEYRDEFKRELNEMMNTLIRLVNKAIF